MCSSAAPSWYLPDSASCSTKPTAVSVRRIPCTVPFGRSSSPASWTTPRPRWPDSPRRIAAARSTGWIVITFGWGMAVMVGAFAVGQFSGAHLNPAVTLGFAVAGDTEWGDVPEYLAGEFVGAFIGATLVWLAYPDHWGATEDPGLKLACYSTAPAIRNPVANIITEIIGTFLLVFGILAIVANAA